MVFGITVATVQAKCFDARRPLVFGRAFAHLDGSNERIPGAAAPILFHGTPGENREDSTPALLNTLNKFILDRSTGRKLAGIKTRRLRINVYSISAGAFCKRPEWNSKLAFAFHLMTRVLHRACRALLPQLRRPHCRTQLFPESAVRTEESQAHGHRGSSDTLGNFLSRVLQDVPQQADLPHFPRELRNRVRH